MKRFLILLLTVLLLSMPVSAAEEHHYQLDTAEAYTRLADLSQFWSLGGNNAATLLLDQTTSAPNRGNGTDPGNYRSIKVLNNLVDYMWGTVRYTPGNMALLNDAIINNSEVTLSFYAKSSENTRIRITLLTDTVSPASAVFETYVDLTPAWTRYDISLREFIGVDTGAYAGLDVLTASAQIPQSRLGLRYIEFLTNTAYSTPSKNLAYWLDTLSLSGVDVMPGGIEEQVGEAPSMGDYDQDGSVSPTDALMNLRVAVGLDKYSRAELLQMDMDVDGEITAIDALLVLRVSVGLDFSY